MDSARKDRAEQLSSVVVNSLDEEKPTADLARRSFHSRTQFHRLFRSLIDETPGAMRRRLLLERSAWQLSRSDRSVTEIALDADYGSLEAFTRAFRRAYGISPSLYRRMGPSYFWLSSVNGVHFCAPGPQKKGTSDMDLFDRFAGHDSWHTRQILEHAKKLTDSQLDAPLKKAVQVVHWEAPEKNLRELLNRIVFWKEIWTAAMTGAELPSMAPPPEQLTVDAMLARYEKTDAEFNRVLGQVRDQGGWDDTFVDALCEPAEKFTFGGVFAHVITFASYRRITALNELRRLGVNVSGMGCPMEYEESVQPWRPVPAT